MIAVRLSLVLVVLSLLAPQVTADDAGHELKADFEKKIFLIRGFYQDKFLHFLPDGTLKKAARTGSWTTSFIFINSLELTPNGIDISGVRVVQVTDLTSHTLHPLRTKVPVSIRIDEVPSDLAENRKSLQRMLIGPTEPLDDLVPEYWRSYLEQQREPSAAEPKGVVPSSRSTECSPVADIAHPCQVSGKIKAPEVIKAPDPTYDPLAEAAKYQGTSVLWVAIDPEGHPRDIRIQRALGFGLDDKAVEAVSRWKFKPATMDGKPVVVQINVEVNFRLY